MTDPDRRPWTDEGERTAAWWELLNKAKAYWLVGLWRQRTPRGVSLGDLVARVYEREPELAPFRLERLCYDFVNAGWRRGGEPRSLLAAGAGLPEESLVLLHAGLGMALTRRLLRPLGAGSPAADLDARMRRFIELARENSRPDLEPVAIEAAGPIVRMFLPRLRVGVAHWMRAAAPEREGFYWHGVGRGAYFLPGSSLPRAGALRHALTVCRREPPDAATRLDALSGLAFAVAMINWHQPWLIERLLGLLGDEPGAASRSAEAREPGMADEPGEIDQPGESDEPGEVDAVASGVAACVLARRITLPDAPPPPLLAYEPREAAGRGRDRAKLWDLHVGDTWKVTPKLSVTYGIRWDVSTPSYEKYDHFTFLDPLGPNSGAGNLPGRLAYAGSRCRPASFGRRHPEINWYHAFRMAPTEARWPIKIGRAHV